MSTSENRQSFNLAKDSRYTVINFKIFSNISSDEIPPHSACKCLQKIGSYSPEVRSFGTLITFLLRLLKYLGL